MSYNRIILIGRLTADPDIKETTNEGKTVAHFTLAVEREYGKDEKGKRKVDFHKIVAWEGSAEFASTYFKKGDPCLVEGELHNRSWKEDGKTRYTSEVEARKIKFVLTRTVDNSFIGDRISAHSFGTNDVDTFADVGEDEDLPF